MRTSFLDYAKIPAAILSDGAGLLIPLWAVSSFSLAQSYHRPPIGASAAKALVDTHDDTINLSAALIGPERFQWKLLLELAAEQAMRGSALSQYTGDAVGGLILITAQTIRTDMYVQSLSFSASSGKQHALDVSLSLLHLPRPGGLAKLLDFAGVAVGTLLDPLAGAT